MRPSQCGNDEIAAFYIRVWGIRTESSTTGVPTKVVDFVANAKLQSINNLSIGIRRFVEVHNTHSVRLAVITRRSDISKFFSRRLQSPFWVMGKKLGQVSIVVTKLFLLFNVTYLHRFSRGPSQPGSLMPSDSFHAVK